MKASSIAKGQFVSVLLPVYNEQPVYLQKAITSILTQSHDNLEMVVIDDGSDYGPTLECLCAAEAMDGRVRLFREPHRGVTGTLNSGLELCRGDVIFRHDSSDWSEPDRIIKQLEFLRSRPGIALASCNMVWHQDNERVLWPTDYPLTSDEIRDAFPRMNPFAHPAACFLRKPALAIGGYREFFLGCEDYDFFWRLFDRFGGENTPDILYHYRISSHSMSADKCYEQALSSPMICYLAEVQATEPEQDLARAREHAEKIIAPREAPFWLFAKAERVALSGDYGRALSLFLSAFKVAPFSLSGHLRFLRSGLTALYPPLGKTLYGRSKTFGVPFVDSFVKVLLAKLVRAR